ncbi:hypothetical protein CMV24_23715 [Pseudomonas plecoglossicida]|uniref:Uncharacterized protein n=1 Tax=Pseudomonas plecoglossicida TaxID=70775 RepID=A0A0B5K1D4_PSEDL|nr:hypothetical protein RK21_02700 [Pseudomonas plecoglossicida]PBJ93111.1 hypothetical protein CMV24_23715 [Pseudomonas plecoglossicida]
MINADQVITDRYRNGLLQKFLSYARPPVGAGSPAKQATRCMAPASPVFAGKPAPTGTAQMLDSA